MLILFLVSFFASTIGAISGIGGGIIIKPVLDLMQLFDVSTITLLSGCTVLSMATYSVLKNLSSRHRQSFDLKITLLALGAASGGLLGKEFFKYLFLIVKLEEVVGAFQSALLALITLLSLFYMVFKKKIQTIQVESKITSSLIGLILGFLSSFLGIGGGPINVVVLNYFYSMETKRASATSLYLIFWSQASALILSLSTGSLPQFSYQFLLIMVLGGIAGGIVGRSLSLKMSSASIDRLMLAVIIFISAVCIFNTFQYLTRY